MYFYLIFLLLHKGHFTVLLAGVLTQFMPSFAMQTRAAVCFGPSRPFSGLQPVFIKPASFYGATHCRVRTGVSRAHCSTLPQHARTTHLPQEPWSGPGSMGPGPAGNPKHTGRGSIQWRSDVESSGRTLPKEGNVPTHPTGPDSDSSGTSRAPDSSSPSAR